MLIIASSLNRVSKNSKMSMMKNKLSSAINNVHNIKTKSSKEIAAKVTPSQLRSNQKNFSLFKKYLNPVNRSHLVYPSTAKHSTDKSSPFQNFDKKKLKVFKKSKKMVNYTTIRKQKPSFERSVDSKSGSTIIMNTVCQTTKNLKSKPITMGHTKSLKDTKVIRFTKNLKSSAKKIPKPKGKDEGVSKCEIDLSRLNIANSSRLNKQNLSCEYNPPKNKIISFSARKSTSPERSELKINDDDFPMSPGNALKLFMNDGLNAFEQSEILDYNKIYYIGKTNKKVDGSATKSLNNGYDDERGDYKFIEHDHI